MKRLIFLAALIGLLAAGARMISVDRVAAFTGDTVDAAGTFLGALFAARPEPVADADPVEAARAKVEALKERAAEWRRKVRELEVLAEARAMREARHERSLSDIRETIRTFVAQAKEARDGCRGSFTFHCRRYATELAERQVRNWCGTEKKVLDMVEVEKKAAEMYRTAADHMRRQLEIVDDARIALGEKIEHLESRRDLLRVEAEIRAVTSTLAGFHRGEVGEAIAALESEIEELAASVDVDSGGEPLVSIEEALVDVAHAACNEETAELARAYWR